MLCAFPFALSLCSQDVRHRLVGSLADQSRYQAWNFDSFKLVASDLSFSFFFFFFLNWQFKRNVFCILDRSPSARLQVWRYFLNNISVNIYIINRLQMTGHFRLDLAAEMCPVPFYKQRMDERTNRF